MAKPVQIAWEEVDPLEPVNGDVSSVLATVDTLRSAWEESDTDLRLRWSSHSAQAQVRSALLRLSRSRRNLAAPSATLGTAALDQLFEPLQIAAHAPLVEAGD
jgi:hypothetical protein